jgi:glycosyltransferase involved in cell wall biosynthesis
MKRILFINHSQNVSGAEKIVLGMLAALGHAHYQPLYACPGGGFLEQEIKEAGLEHIALPAVYLVRSKPLDWLRLLLAWLQWSLALFRIIRRTQVVMLHANSMTAAMLSVIPGRLLRTPVIWHMMDMLKITRTNALMAAVLGRQVEAVICISRAVKDNLLKLGVPEHKLCMIYPVFAPLQASRLTPAEAKTRLGLPCDAVVIGIVGQIAEWKGQHVFLQAAELLAGKPGLGDVRFAIIGDVLTHHSRPYKDRLLRAVRNGNLAGCVTLTGYQKHVYDYMRALDVLVHASVLEEPYGMVLVEGMANGCCIVAARGGGVTEIIDDGQTGILVTAGSPAELAETLERLILNQAERRRLAARALEGPQLRAYEANLRELQALYGRVIAGPAA